MSNETGETVSQLKEANAKLLALSETLKVHLLKIKFKKMKDGNGTKLHFDGLMTIFLENYQDDDELSNFARQVWGKSLLYVFENF